MTLQIDGGPRLRRVGPAQGLAGEGREAEPPRISNFKFQIATVGDGYTEMLLPFAITEEPLDVGGLLGLAQSRHAEKAAASGHEGPGAVIAFVGTVRGTHLGQDVRALTYEAYAPLAVASFERIEHEAAQRFPGVVLAIHHRVGTLDVGVPSIVIVAVAAHRAEAYAASRFAIERVKQISPVWKREHLMDGASWVEGATVDPEDPAPLADAWRRACP